MKVREVGERMSWFESPLFLKKRRRQYGDYYETDYLRNLIWGKEESYSRMRIRFVQLVEVKMRRLFLECQMTYEVWVGTLKWLNIPLTLHNQIKVHFNDFSSLFWGKKGINLDVGIWICGFGCYRNEETNAFLRMRNEIRRKF